MASAQSPARHAPFPVRRVEPSVVLIEFERVAHELERAVATSEQVGRALDPLDDGHKGARQTAVERADRDRQIAAADRDRRGAPEEPRGRRGLDEEIAVDRLIVGADVVVHLGHKRVHVGRQAAEPADVDLDADLVHQTREDQRGGRGLGEPGIVLVRSGTPL